MIPHLRALQSRPLAALLAHAVSLRLFACTTRFVFGCAILANSILCEPVAAEVLVTFDQDTYFVSGPGESMDISVLVDGVSSTADLDAVRRGLFSFAIEMGFNPAKAEVGSLAAIEPAAELDFFGLAAGAFKSISPGLAGVKGNIRQQDDPLVPYSGTFLAKFTLTNLATGPDSYPLSLDFFRTVGANEQFFLDGAGAVLDPQIEFGAAQVVVIPEPATGLLMLLALSVLPVLARAKAR